MVIHPLIYRKGGGEEEPTGEGHRVRFFDYDGTLLKTEFVADGGTAITPAVPNPVPATDKNPALTHGFSWNNSVYNIKSDVDMGNIYSTLDGKTYIYIELDEYTGYTGELMFFKNDTYTMYVDWGDGSAVESSSVSGNVEFTHTYSKGNYIIKFWFDSIGKGQLRLGQNDKEKTLFGSDKKFKAGVKRIFIGGNVTHVYTYGLADLINMEVISISSLLTNFGTYALTNSYKLQHVNFSGQMTTVNSALLSGAYSLKNVTWSNSITSIANSCLNGACNVKRLVLPYNLQTTTNYCFLNMRGLTHMTIPPNVTALGIQTFGSMVLVERYKVTPTTPPTITDTTFLNYNVKCKWYVPDASWSLYNSADYWKDLNLVKMSEWEEL